MEKMTHVQRVRAALEGKPVDRPPFTAWGPHMNLEDRHGGDFTKAVIAYQNQYDFDILKVMQSGLYHCEDYGLVIDPPVDIDDVGYKKTRVPAFTCLDDWKNATKKDVHAGVFGREVDNIRILHEYYGDDLPILPTIFGPMRFLAQLCGYGFGREMVYEGKPCFVGAHIMNYVHAHEEEYFHVMDVLTEQLIDLMNAYLDVGAAGFFFCSSGQFPGQETDEEYEKYIRPYDVRCLEAIKDRAWFTMLHVCGTNLQRMDRMVTLPAQAINWEDQSPANPSLAEVRAMTADKVLMGGIDRWHDFAGPDRDAIKKRLREKAEKAVQEAGPKLVVAIGCEAPREIMPRIVVWHEVMDEMAK